MIFEIKENQFLKDGKPFKIIPEVEFGSEPII